MRVTSISLKNFRSFVDMAPIELGAINVLLGPNNAGKSSIIRGLYAMQTGIAGALTSDVRLGAAQANIELDLAGVTDVQEWGEAGQCNIGHLQIKIAREGTIAHTISYTTAENQRVGVGVPQIPSVEPRHFVVPYLTKRKAIMYQEDVREQFALQVAPDFSHLAAKLSRLGNPSFPAHEQYRRTCEEILGFVVTAVPSANGQVAGVYVSQTETIPIEQMGDGVPNIVGLLAELALARGKLFLMEEPENDLHPEALKALLDLMAKAAVDNQFVVSTHSSIVARHLGSIDDSRLYHVTTERGVLPPVAAITLVEPTPAARIRVLRELGYAFSDFDLWDGWLILEESSAERIIRDYLIPFFAPKLSRVRTLAAGGNQDVEPTFADFYRIVRFTHLEDAYRDRAWVLIDGDGPGRQIVEQLRERYPTWKSEHFDCFDQAQFERYYPDEFATRVQAVLAMPDRPAQREAKRQLLDEVRAWLDQDRGRAESALATSAGPVIERLERIESELDL